MLAHILHREGLGGRALLVQLGKSSGTASASPPECSTAVAGWDLLGLGGGGTKAVRLQAAGPRHVCKEGQLVAFLRGAVSPLRAGPPCTHGWHGRHADQQGAGTRSGNDPCMRPAQVPCATPVGYVNPSTQPACWTLTASRPVTAAPAAVAAASPVPLLRRLALCLNHPSPNAVFGAAL